MYIIQARNVQQALPMGIDLLKSHGIREKSRAGDVLRYPGPVVTILEKPQERVIFYPWRDANPFFHIVEAAWMLAGRNTLADLTPYVKRMSQFSDDGGLTQPGAYGKRWRDWTGDDYSVLWRDQLNWVVRRLRANPNDRRVVIQMWDPEYDREAADRNGADVPCNLGMIPWVMNGALHLSIFNRSNDIIWGLYGANAVHFSVVLEYLAQRLGLAVGTLTTFSNNFHAYTNILDKIDEACSGDDPYEVGVVSPLRLLQGTFIPSDDEVRERWIHNDLMLFFDQGAEAALTGARWPWVRSVLAPMALAHQFHKAKRPHDARAMLAKVWADDWRLAGKEWIARRNGG